MCVQAIERSSFVSRKSAAARPTRQHKLHPTVPQKGGAREACDKILF